MSGSTEGLIMPPKAPLPDEERLRLKVPDRLMPELAKACKSVVRVGWEKMQWPRNFSAMHLAAKVGSEDAVRLLLLANAHSGLSLRDNRGMRPLDLAKKQHGGTSPSLLAMLDPVKYRFTELRVKVDHIDSNVKFRHAPVEEQVAEVCSVLQVSFDDKDNYRMITTAEDVRILSTIGQLMSMREGSRVSLEKVGDLLKRGIAGVRRSLQSAENPSEEIPVALRRLSTMLQADERCVQEFIDQKGMAVILEAFVTPKCGAEPPAACLCYLLQFPFCNEWLRENWAKYAKLLFRRILGELFPVEQQEQLVSPYATLLMCLFLILELKESALDAFHEAALGLGEAIAVPTEVAGGGDAIPAVPFYRPIVKSVVDENASYFEACAAHAILCTVLNAAAASTNQGRYKEIWDEIVRWAGSENKVKQLRTKADREELFQKEAVMISMSTSAESFAGDQVAELHCLRKALAHTQEQLKKEREKDKKDIETLQGELRNRQQALKSMVSFINIESAPLVEQVLETVVHHGWDDMQWQNGYTLLHHVCECSDDPSVVDLVACLATDLETVTDDTNMRPIDFARNNPVPGIRKVLERHRHARNKSSAPSRPKKDPTDDDTMADARKLRRMDTAPKLDSPWANEGSKSPRPSTGGGDAGGAAAKAEQPSQSSSSPSKPRQRSPAPEQHSQQPKVSAQQPPTSQPKQQSSAQQTQPVSQSRLKIPEQEALGSQSPAGARSPRARSPGGLAAAAASAAGGAVSSSAAASGITPAVEKAITAFKSIRKAPKDAARQLGIQPGALSKTLDLERARVFANENKDTDTDTLGLNELRKLLLNSEAEREKLQKKLVEQQPGGSSVGTRSALAMGFGGPLNEAQVSEYYPQYKTYGSAMLSEKLQRPALAGGLALDNSDAAAALAQLEQLGRLIKVVEPTSKGVGGAPEAEPAVATAPAGAAGPGSAKGKSSKGPGPKGAKGPAPPSPQQPQAGGGGAAENVAAPDASSAGSPTPGGKKGKKGSPPPPPGVAKGSVGATPAGDTQAAAGPAPGPKGSAMPPAKGGKGPAPPGKGPGGGKGPPAPGGGKGPLAPAGPGGKGPTGPAGPVAGGKKGGKGKGGAVQLTKPVRKPAVPMKSLQWIRRVYGGGLVKGESIWDEVNTVYDESHIPTEEIEARFSKSAGLMKVEKAGQEKATKKIKEYTVLPSQERLPFEVMATSLPPTDKLAKAIQNMDDEFMSAQWIKDLQPFCPDAERLEQLRALQPKLEETPDIPLGKVEQYMWALGQITACRMRLRCWDYIRQIADQLDMFQEQLGAFDIMLDSFTNHTPIALCLAMVLAFGNFLNGGNSRLGQADGFGLDVLPALDGVKDPKGKDIRQLIFKVFFEKYPRQAEELLQDVSLGIQGLLQRQIVKSDDGSGDESLQRSIRICIEDLDAQIGKIKVEHEKMHKEFKEGQSFINDPADLYKMRMPSQFEQTLERITRLARETEDSKKRFDATLAWFCAKDTMQKRLADREAEAKEKEQMSSGKKVAKAKQVTISSDWCCMWDEFLVPKALVDRCDDKTKKNVIVPRFCKGKAIDIEGMKLLWELVDPEEEKKQKKTVSKRRAGGAGASGGGARAR